MLKSLLTLLGHARAPIRALAETAASISEDRLSTRLDERGAPQEVRELARAFNASLDRLESAFARQAHFTADASHELRTHLTVIRTQAEVALKGACTRREQRAALEACSRGAVRMTGLVEGLLSLARSDAGAEHGPAEDVALHEIVSESVDFLRPAAGAARVELSCAAAPVRVRGNPCLLADVLTNLVDNALRYTGRDGRVDVALGCEGGEAVLRVSDTGIGIPADALPHVFERFYRGDPSLSRERGGSGLGLAIVRSIVEFHRGSIAVESRPDAGTTFTVRLPATAAGAERSDIRETLAART